MLPLEFADPRAHRFVCETKPLAVVGRVSRWDAATRTAAIAWPRNASGQRATPSAHVLAVDRCLGVVSVAGGTGDVGSWALYRGPSVDKGRRLASIIARQTVRSHDGSIVSSFRCRQEGLGPDMDVWMQRDVMAELWPETDTAIEAYLKVCRDLTDPAL